MKVGIDIVEVKRIKRIFKHNNLEKIFNLGELEQINKSKKPYERASGYFAVKESVLKAFGLGLFNGLALNEIIVEYNEQGAPKINKTEKIENLLSKAGLTEIEISISHTKQLATAICMLN